MSLWDVDKSGDNRLAPEPNQNDEQLQRMAHGTTQHQHSKDGAAVDGLKFLERYVLAKYQGVNKAVFGFLNSTNKFGFKVAKDGFDVLTTGDANLIMSSDYDMFKIVGTGTTSLVIDDPMTAKEVQTVTIPHGLSITPSFLVFVTLPNYGTSYVGAGQLNQMPFTLFTYNITPVVYSFASADATNLYIKVANLYNTTLAGLAGTWTFRYYILQETAN